ncbi:hypothetical protein Tco_0169226 [Tanacetum coccineum]
MTIAEKNDITWLMASMGLSPCLNTGTIRPESDWGNSGCFGCWLTTDKVIHTVETDMVKLVVDIKSFGKNSDEIDKETMSFDELQLKQVGLNCVHALDGLHLHEIHVVLSKHEADQYIQVIDADNPPKHAFVVFINTNRTLMVAGGEVVEVTAGWICGGGGVEWDGVVVMVRGDGDDYIGDDVG